MRVDIIAVGRLKHGPQKDLFETYLKRMSWQTNCRETDSGKSPDDEEKKILPLLSKQGKVIALDERGKDLSSTAFAQKIGAWQTEGMSNFTFIIGGADGLSENIRKQADLMLAFGRQTWPHQMVRIMLIEQLYRAQQILSGHPYHRE